MHPGTALDGCFAFFFCDDGVQGSIREWRVWGPLTHVMREEGSEQERRATSDELTTPALYPQPTYGKPLAAKLCGRMINSGQLLP